MERNFFSENTINLINFYFPLYDQKNLVIFNRSEEINLLEIFNNIEFLHHNFSILKSIYLNKIEQP